MLKKHKRGNKWIDQGERETEGDRERERVKGEFGRTIGREERKKLN